MDKTRVHDYKIIETGLKDRDINVRDQAKKAMEKIKREDSWVKSARESLVRESLNRNIDNVKDIGDEIIKRKGRKGYQDNTSFSFSFPEGFWSKNV